MSLINKTIVPFSVDAYKPGEKDFISVSDKDIEGKWSVFFFYPADFTFVCPTELADLADYHEEFEKLGVEIFSVSTDSHWTHKAWQQSSDAIANIRYTMLSDDQFHLSTNFKVLRESEGRANRATFIVDPKGVIQAYEMTSEGIGRDAGELFRKVKAAQYVYNNPDEVCPAKWKEGEETLTPSLDLSGKI